MNTKVNEGKLISGKEALIALANGEEVEFFYRDAWDSIGEMIVIDHFISDKFKFRLKPRTITINGIEVPAPFEPKEGEMYFYLNPHAHAGYGPNTTIEWSKYLQFGVWRTEEEVKQVVAALRQVFGGSHDN